MIIALHTIQMPLYNNFFTFGYLHMPQRAATSMFFLISSYFFWVSINSSQNVYKTFIKHITRWLTCYAFWSFLHLRFYYFDWFYATYGVLWFLYALIIGNIIVFLTTRIIDNKYFYLFSAVALSLFMSLADAWYNCAVNLPIIGKIITVYYNIFVSMLSPFTMGIVFSVVAYLLAGLISNRSPNKISVKKHCGIAALFLTLFAVEGYYTCMHGFPKHYTFFFSTMPLCVSVFTLILKINIKVPYARCLGKLSALLYYIHILFYYYWVNTYSPVYEAYPESTKDFHTFFYTFICASWVSFIIYLLSKKVPILKSLF